MSGFRDLKVWQKSKELAVLIYRVTQEQVFRRDFGFKDQIRRAAISIPSNIAEGMNAVLIKMLLDFSTLLKDP